MSIIKTPQEQINYANLLFYGCWTSLALMAVTFVIYLTGFMEPHVPTEQLMSLWGGPSAKYLEVANVPHGWGWTALLGKGDFLNFLGIVLLASMTLIAYLPLIPAYLKKKQPLFAAIAILEVLVLALAASGLVGAGGH